MTHFTSTRSYPNKVISANFQKAYTTFAESLKAHDEIKDIYIANMSFAKANELTNELIDLFFAEETAEKTSNIKHRFLGAATPTKAYKDKMKEAISYLAEAKETIDQLETLTELEILLYQIIFMA
jgi:hypothetical protein